MIYVSVWHFSADSLLRGAECFGDKHLTAVGHLKDARAGKQRFKKSGSKGQRRREEQWRKERERCRLAERRAAQRRAEGDSTSHGLSCPKTSDQKHCWVNYRPDDCKLLRGAGRSWVPVFQYLFSA